MNREGFIAKAEDYLRDAEDTSYHPADRIEAYMNLAFHYGRDYHNAYKYFRKAYDLVLEL